MPVRRQNAINFLCYVPLFQRLMCSLKANEEHSIQIGWTWTAVCDADWRGHFRSAETLHFLWQSTRWFHFVHFYFFDSSFHGSSLRCLFSNGFRRLVTMSRRHENDKAECSSTVSFLEIEILRWFNVGIIRSMSKQITKWTILIA